MFFRVLPQNNNQLHVILLKNKDLNFKLLPVTKLSIKSLI